MKPTHIAIPLISTCLLYLLCTSRPVKSQSTDSVPIVPIATQWTLQAVTAPQKTAVKAVILIECRKAGRKGTAFLLKSGTVVTNFHVVDGCSVNELWARSPMGQTISFAKMATDDKRDLAILRPNARLEGGLELGSDTDPSLEASVKTWGYPLNYEDFAPILSKGYVAGYIARATGNQTIKHLIVNGALNPGNSGGPLLSEGDNRVVGVVVSKWKLFSPRIEAAIEGFSRTQNGISGTFSETLADGTQRSITNEKVTAEVLQEFYEKTQVMIGEAISVSELKSFLHEKEESLR